jgi:hypothetical protein
MSWHEPHATEKTFLVYTNIYTIVNKNVPDMLRASKEQLPMWERRPPRNLGEFLAVARPHRGINTLTR